MDSDDFLEYGHNYQNFIDSELEKQIRIFSEEKEIAVVLSSGGSIVNGFYSTEQPEIPTYLPQIKYKGNTFWAENIAKNMCSAQERDFASIAFLKQLSPYALAVSAQPTKSGFRFQVLIAGDITDKKRDAILSVIEKTWKERVGYSLNL